MSRRMPVQNQASKIGSDYSPLRDQVREELRDRIGDGRLAPGQHLIETALAEEFGVSRIPVREALRGLEREGLVTTVPRRGVVVSELTRADIVHLFEVRSALEVLAFRLAAEHATDDDMEHLRAVLADTQDAIDRNDRLETVRGNMQFHDSVMRISGNPFLASALEPLLGRIRWLIGHGHEPQRDISEHRALAEAIGAHDPDGAAALAAAHLLASRTHGLREYDAHHNA